MRATCIVVFALCAGNRDCEYSMICTNDALKRHGGNPFQLEVEGDGKGWKQVQMQPNEGMTLSQRAPIHGDAYGGGDYENEAVRLSQRREYFNSSTAVGAETRHLIPGLMGGSAGHDLCWLMLP